jgi:hypothetical protein
MLKNEKGTALLTALIMLLLLTLIGFAAITTSSVEVQISGNQRVGITAMYAFEAGIESIRQELNNYIDNNPDKYITINNYSSPIGTSPSYTIYSGIESYPSKGVVGRGDNWASYNQGNKVIVIRNGSSPNIDGSDMFVFLVEGTSGFASKSVEVGIIPRQTTAASGGVPDPSGTGGYGGGSS